MAESKNLPFWSSFKLNDNSQEIPYLGLYNLALGSKEELFEAIDVALGSGYRLFDVSKTNGKSTYFKTAINKCLTKHGLEREDIYIIGKLSNIEMHSENIVKHAYERAVNSLGIYFFDLFLIGTGDDGVHTSGNANMKYKMRRKTAWAALTDLYDNARVNAIGVSDFSIDNFKELLNDHHNVVPAVNQVKWNPCLYNDELLKFCRSNDVTVQGYSPFGNSNNELLESKAVKSVAKELNVTPAQVLLVWSLQNNVVTMHDSTDLNEIRENIKLDFKLSGKQMKNLRHLMGAKKIVKY